MQTNTGELAGTRVGSCTIERLLGVGGMSAIYLARQERPRRQVAVKLLRAGSASSPDAWKQTLARFHREADAAAALDHANIVPIYEFGVEATGDGEIAYIVMPYLADGSLAALLARLGPLDVPLALLYLDQAAAALDFAHHAGIIHRDVKPSNLLLHPDGRLLLADFGVARALHRLQDADMTGSGMTLGTPEYMAPEQIRGERVGPATDNYALGVVAYALLTGHTPFEVPALVPIGASESRDKQGEMRAILTRQLTEPPPPLRTQRAGISARLEEAIFWALAKDPADRPQTAGMFARAAREGSRSRVVNAFFSLAGGRADALLAAGFATSLPRFQTPASAPIMLAYGPQSLSGSHDPGAGAPPGPDTPTIQDLPSLADRPAPQWPSPARGPEPKPPNSPMKLVLIAAGALLACAFLASGIGVVGFLLQSAGSSLNTPPLVTTTTQPTMTPEPTATAAPSIVLAVSPASVTIPCRSSDRRIPTVTLTNKGQDTAQWSATPDGPQIFVSPSSGSLDPGKRQTIKLASLTLSSQDRQGTLKFTADGMATGGGGVAVSYTLQSCSRASVENGDGDGALAAQLLAAQLSGKGGGHRRKHGDG
jgi:serine/threonine protein kinase